jgi:bacterioferritin-associated ferredoxin
MWVCMCHSLRCHDVKTAANRGARRAAEVFHQFEVEPRCGKCVPTIRGLLAESHQPLAAASPSHHGKA